MSPADHHCAKRIASLWEQATRSLAKIANYLHAARGQLPTEDFNAIVGELPFPRECVDDFLAISKFSQQKPLAFSQAVTTGLHALAKMIEPAQATVKRGPRPIAVVSEAKFKAITGLTGDEFDRVASLPPDEFQTAVNIGIRSYLDTQAKATEAVLPPAGEPAELLRAAE
jgi:hypothetical protein